MLTERIWIIFYADLAGMKTLVHILSTIYLDAFRKVNVLLEESYRSMTDPFLGTQTRGGLTPGSLEGPLEAAFLLQRYSQQEVQRKKCQGVRSLQRAIFPAKLGVFCLHSQ